MKFNNAKSDLQFILSLFSDNFSRPSFRLFTSFVTGFIRLGKEAHTSSMVKALSCPSLQRSLTSFTRFLAKNAWSQEQIIRIKLDQFFLQLHIKANSILFLLIDDTLVRKSGKKIPGCSWYRDHTHHLARIFGHQWLLSALLYRDFLLPLRAKLYHPKGARGCGPFHTKITLAKKIIQSLHLPVPCKLYVLVDSWYWTKELVKFCRRGGYHMISQLKSNSILCIEGKRTKLRTLINQFPCREISISLYGKTRNLSLAKFIGEIHGLGKVAVVVVREKRKRPVYLVSTNLYLSAIDVVKYYAKRWKIEQMIKDLKQRLGFGDYQIRTLKAIERHVALVLLSYFVLVLLKVLQWLRDKKQALDLSIRCLAFQLRRYILIESINLTLKTMRIRFNQNILDTYLEQLWA